jgi:uncharacterized protein YukE
MGELESYLPYDSYGMRALAGTIQAQARTVADASSGIDGASGGMTFDGPAGDRIRNGLSQSSTRLASVSRALDSAARQLRSAAQEVDDQNAAISRHNQAVLEAMPPMERKLVLENM